MARLKRVQSSKSKGVQLNSDLRSLHIKTSHRAYSPNSSSTQTGVQQPMQSPRFNALTARNSPRMLLQESNNMQNLMVTNLSEISQVGESRQNSIFYNRKYCTENYNMKSTHINSRSFLSPSNQHE